MPRRAKIYTRRGDDGTTGLGGGQRVVKSHQRVQAYGTVDELNASLGIAIASGLDDRLIEELRVIQNELFNLGADLSFREDEKKKHELPSIEPHHLTALEELIDELSEAAGPLKNFILPGGSAGAALLHVARTVCRRAEREVARLQESEPIGPLALPYLNRLADALFVMARYENLSRGVGDQPWEP